MTDLKALSDAATQGVVTSDPNGIGCIGDVSTLDGECIAQMQQIAGDHLYTVRTANTNPLNPFPHGLP